MYSLSYKNKILSKLLKLKKKDRLFYSHNKLRDIERLLNITPNTLHTVLNELNISLYKERENEFITIVEELDVEELNLKNIQRIFKYRYVSQVYKKFKQYYGISLKEYKQQRRENEI